MHGEGNSLRRSQRSQSAMEYLMTYGWAILIIAVVLGALYSLGVFNAVNFMPKVPGGGCHVFRPNGPGTSWNVNLVGSCNNALPQYVAQFDGKSSYVSTGTTGMPVGNSARSAFAWVYFNSFSGSPYILDYGTYQTPNQLSLLIISSNVLRAGSIANGYSFFSTFSPSLKSWHFVGYAYDGATMTIYMDGQSQSHSILTLNTIISGSDIGGLYLSGFNQQHFNGSIANVQIYNTSLSANQVAYLYNEGIGGMPISPQYLVGWWPLNGDTNDYSGNNNNGAPTSIAFNGTWTGGYNVP